MPATPEEAEQALRVRMIKLRLEELEARKAVEILEAELGVSSTPECASSEASSSTGGQVVVIDIPPVATVGPRDEVIVTELASRMTTERQQLDQERQLLTATSMANSLLTLRATMAPWWVRVNINLRDAARSVGLPIAVEDAGPLDVSAVTRHYVTWHEWARRFAWGFGAGLVFCAGAYVHLQVGSPRGFAQDVVNATEAMGTALSSVRASGATSNSLGQLVRRTVQEAFIEPRGMRRVSLGMARVCSSSWAWRGLGMLAGVVGGALATLTCRRTVYVPADLEVATLMLDTVGVPRRLQDYAKLMHPNGVLGITAANSGAMSVFVRRWLEEKHKNDIPDDEMAKAAVWAPALLAVLSMCRFASNASDQIVGSLTGATDALALAGLQPASVLAERAEAVVRP